MQILFYRGTTAARIIIIESMIIHHKIVTALDGSILSWNGICASWIGGNVKLRFCGRMPCENAVWILVIITLCLLPYNTTIEIGFSFL
jgi:hypothetical protein